MMQIFLLLALLAFASAFTMGPRSFVPVSLKLEKKVDVFVSCKSIILTLKLVS